MERFSDSLARDGEGQQHVVEDAGGDVLGQGFEPWPVAIAPGAGGLDGQIPVQQLVPHLDDAGAGVAATTANFEGCIAQGSDMTIKLTSPLTIF